MGISKIKPNLTIEYLVEEKESIFFERKGVFDPKGKIDFNPSKLANEIIGMLNANGGLIVLGINNGKIQDLKKLDNTKFNDFKQVVHDFIIPPALVEIEEVEIDGKLILLYHIEQDKERLFSRKDNENVYLRVGDETKKLNREEIKKLEYDKSIRNFEDEEIKDFQEEDFRMSVINYYKDKLKFSGDYRDLLVSRNLARKENGKYIYKKSAILLFSQNPDKYIPSASVRYIKYDGIKQKTGTNLNIIKDEIFYASIPRLIELLKRFLKNVLRDYYYLDLETGKFVKITEYPEEAWLEGIVNALTHRSYNLQGNVVYIKHYDNRIEISNSGPLPSIVTVENIRNTRFSRNPRIARVLYEMGYVRELNEGVNRIFEVMKKSFLSEPTYLDKDDIVTLILENNVMKSKQTISEKIMAKIEKIFFDLNDTEKKVLEFLMKNGQATKLEIAEKIGVSEKTVRRYLKKFIELGLVLNLSGKQRGNDIIYSINYKESD